MLTWSEVNISLPTKLPHPELAQRRLAQVGSKSPTFILPSSMFPTMPAPLPCHVFNDVCPFCLWRTASRSRSLPPPPQPFLRPETHRPPSATTRQDWSPNEHQDGKVIPSLLLLPWIYADNFAFQIYIEDVKVPMARSPMASGLAAKV